MSLLQSLFGKEKSGVADVPRTNQSLFDTTVSIPEKKKEETAPTFGPELPPGWKPDSEAESSTEDDQEENKARTIFVGNLPLSFVQRRRRLAALFQDCGAIQSSRLRSVATSGVKLPPQQAGNQRMVQKVCINTRLIDADLKKSVSAYVVFVDASSVEKALAKNNMTVKDDDSKELRHIRVDRADPTYDPAQTVFVGNLPYGADEESLAAYFRNRQKLPVQAVRIVRDKETHKCKGFGYVLFDDKASVAKALEHPDDATNYMGRHLRVQVCGKRFKSKASQHHQSNKKPRQEAMMEAVGAVRRVLAKQDTDQHKKKRARNNDNTGKKVTPHKATGVSKRAASQAKVNQRVKKIEKRISKGMGKAKRG